MYRGGTWLSPLHRMVPLPRSFAADAHGCIMVAGRHGPTEYKVVAQRSALVARLRSDHLVKRFGPAAGGWTGNAPRQGSRLRAPALRLTALTRPRSQSVSLVIASARGADARSKQERDQSGDVALDNKHPIQGTSRAPLRRPHDGAALRAGPSCGLPGQALAPITPKHSQQGASSSCRQGTSSGRRLTHVRQSGSDLGYRL